MFRWRGLFVRLLRGRANDSYLLGVFCEYQERILSASVAFGFVPEILAQVFHLYWILEMWWERLYSNTRVCYSSSGSVEEVRDLEIIHSNMPIKRVYLLRAYTEFKKSWLAVVRCWDGRSKARSTWIVRKYQYLGGLDWMKQLSKHKIIPPATTLQKEMRRAY